MLTRFGVFLFLIGHSVLINHIMLVFVFNLFAQSFSLKSDSEMLRYAYAELEESRGAIQVWQVGHLLEIVIVVKTLSETSTKKMATLEYKMGEQSSYYLSSGSELGPNPSLRTVINVISNYVSPHWKA